MLNQPSKMTEQQAIILRRALVRLSSLIGYMRAEHYLAPECRDSIERDMRQAQEALTLTTMYPR